MGKLKNADVFGSFRVVCAEWPIDQCMLKSGNWSKAGLVARKWHRQVQNLAVQSRIRRLIGGVTGGSSDGEMSNNTVTFLKAKVVEMYGALNPRITVEEFSGFKNARNKKFFVVEIESRDRSYVPDLVVGYCDSCGIRSRP